MMITNIVNYKVNYEPTVNFSHLRLLANTIKG